MAVNVTDITELLKCTITYGGRINGTLYTFRTGSSIGYTKGCNNPILMQDFKKF